MPHVDEGRLHAFLDAVERGPRSTAESQDLEQHLEECPACRERLEEARALRQRASAILGGSGPLDAAPPAFEDLLARKRALSARRVVFRLNRLTALGWAATIVLAAGVGWMARGSLEFFETQTDHVAIEPVATRRGAAPSSEAQAVPQTAAAKRSAEAASGLGPGADVPSRPAAEGEPGAGAAEEQVAALDERLAQVAAAPSPPPTAPAAADAQKAAGGVRVAEPAQEPARLPTNQPARQREARAEAAARDVDAQRAVLGLAVSEPASPWPSGRAPAVAIDWALTTLRDAEEHLGARVLTIPDREASMIEAATIGDVAVIRVTFGVAPDDLVEVTQWRWGAGTRELTTAEIDAITASTSLFRKLNVAQVYASGARRDGYRLLAVGPRPDRLAEVLAVMR